MQETYIPLHRKYRPQKFADLVGQDNLVKALSNAIKLNKIAHAYLFCGPRGTGKTSSARIFAKSLNCINGPTLEPCGTCPSCVNITNSTPVDVIEIDAASNTGVEHAREILEKIQYAPVDGKYKIYIIDEVHMLSNSAFNALLKTLEEPPKNVIFIFATTEVHKVLDTIISRCQRFDFRRITTEDIVKRLEYISQKENINISKDALFNIAKSSQGGMRDSLALLDQVSILNSYKEISSSDIDDLLGKINVEKLFAIVEDFRNTDAKEALLKVNNMYDNGCEPAQIVENLIQYLRDLLIVKNTKDSNIIFDVSKLNEQNIELMRPQAEAFENEHLIFMLDKLMYYLKTIKDTSNRHLFMELAVVELANNNNYYSYKELIEKVQKLEAQIQGGAQAVSANAPAVNLPKPKIMQERETSDEKKDNKSDVIAQINEGESVAIQIETENELITQGSQKQGEDSRVDEPQKTKRPSEIVSATSDGQEKTSEDENSQKQIQGEDNVGSNAQPEENVQTGNWLELLSNIDSIPSRMFFNNLAKPVEITSNKISVGFMKDAFVKQAKEDTKRIPLENAAKKYFGVSSIAIDIKLLDENYKVPSFATPSVKKVSEPQNATIIKQDISNTKISEKSEDEGYYDTLLQEKQETLNKQTPHSDGSKMVQELFDGKYL